MCRVVCRRDAIVRPASGLASAATSLGAASTAIGSVASAAFSVTSDVATSPAAATAAACAMYGRPVRATRGRK